MLKRKAVFWDRDGIINQIKVENGVSLSPRKFKDFKVFPFIKDLLFDIKDLGYINIIFTNQPDISRLLMDKKELGLMNEFLLNNFPIEKIYCCPHSDEDNCHCRKPLPGMVKAGIKEFSLNKIESVVIGDRITDLIAGYKAGIKNLFLYERSYSLNCYSKLTNIKYTSISDLKDLPKLILQTKDD